MVLAFFWIFQPFGMFTFSREQTPVIFGYIFIALIFWLIHLFLIQPFFRFEWTIGSTIIWLSWINFSIGIAITFFNNLIYDYESLTVGHFLVVQWVSWTVGVLPLILIVLIHENYLLRKRTKKAEEISEANSRRKKTVSSNSEITFPAENKKNNLTFDIEKVLYLTTEDNYVGIYHEADGKVNRAFIRNTLKEIEKSFPDHPTLFRCHKSYIINLDKIKKVTGNAAGYKLHFENIPEEIPVSRSLNKKIFSLLKA